MATRQEAREHVIDLILNFIITNATKDVGSVDVGIDLSSYRRYIDSTTGQITTGATSPDSSFVLYEKDFRESFDPDLLNVVDEIIDNCVTETSTEVYDLSGIVDTNWNIIPGGTTCTNFLDSSTNIYGGISFNGPANSTYEPADCSGAR